MLQGLKSVSKTRKEIGFCVGLNKIIYKDLISVIKTTNFTIV